MIIRPYWKHIQRTSQIWHMFVCLTLAAILVFVPSAIRSANPPSPPPIAFSNLSTDVQEYYVMDFQSGDVTTVPRTGRLPREPGGETVMPQELTMQSPYDKISQFIFVNESGKQPEGSREGYVLYRINTNGDRVRILEKALLGSSQDWSPNGRFFYIRADYNYDSQLSSIYQYDLQAGTSVRLVTNLSGVLSCLKQTEWCLFNIQPQSEHENTAKTLFVLDKNTGEINPVATSRRTIYTWWQDDDNSFIYDLPFAENWQAIRLYKFSNQSDDLIAEMNVRYAGSPLWSPDHHWLAMQARTGADLETVDLVVIDTRKEQPAPQLISEGIDEPVGGAYTRWLSSDRIFFDTALLDNSGFRFYTALLPEGVPHQAAEIARPESSILDSTWSPDNRWLALSFYAQAGKTPSFYVVDGLGETPMREVPTDFPEGTIICLGWYRPEVYAAGDATLCDFYMGIG